MLLLHWPNLTAMYQRAPHTLLLWCTVSVQDVENEEKIPLTRVSVDEILDLQREEQLSRQHSEEIKKKAMQERGLIFHSDPIQDDFFWLLHCVLAKVYYTATDLHHWYYTTTDVSCCKQLQTNDVEKQGLLKHNIALYLQLRGALTQTPTEALDLCTWMPLRTSEFCPQTSSSPITHPDTTF